MFYFILLDNLLTINLNILSTYELFFCFQVLELMKEVSEDKDDDGEGSDISGYHSDSESAVMTSGNSPFISIPNV